MMAHVLNRVSKELLLLKTMMGYFNSERLKNTRIYDRRCQWAEILTELP